MILDGLFRRTAFARNLLVQIAFHHERHDLALARRKLIQPARDISEFRASCKRVAAFHGAECVLQQIDHDLLQLGVVAAYFRQMPVDVESHAYATRACARNFSGTCFYRQKGYS